ncbi:MAG: type III pantothenate kinase, partial [Candidatus Gastranaerophilales bacterium]|nr:type III pantothenate kinase [Candidatus Gastranaerophilales bacterium]
MLFVADIGNTSITAGVYEGENLLYTWKLASDKKRSEDEYGVILHNFINQFGVRDLEGAIVSSVVLPLTQRFEVAIEKYLKVPVINLTHKTKTGIVIDLDKPGEVGPDRLANACAAHHLYGKTAVVVDFGTATSFDIVSSDGKFLGGVIAPGIRISADALNAFTSLLPKVRIEAPPSAIGKNTIDAMLTGLVRGHGAMIDGLIADVENELGEPVITIATGGYSTIVTDILKRPFDYLNPTL